MLYFSFLFFVYFYFFFFFFSSRRRHTISLRDWSSDVCSSDLWPHSPDEGREAPCGAPLICLEARPQAVSGAATGASYSASIRASSSSVPWRIGPLNHLRAESTYQPPKRRNAPMTG